MGRRGKYPAEVRERAVRFSSGRLAYGIGVSLRPMREMSPDA